MNAVVFTKRRTDAAIVKKALCDAGHHCVVTTTLNSAKEAVHRTNADCLYFARSLAGSYGDFFQAIDSRYLFYAVIQEQVHFSDYADAIAAINSHRVVDYLLCPLTSERVLQSVALYQEYIIIVQSRQWEYHKAISANKPYGYAHNDDRRF